MEKKFVVKTNPPYQKVVSHKGVYEVPSKSKYSINYDGKTVLHISDSLLNNKGMATRVANLLNEDRKYKLTGLDV